MSKMSRELFLQALETDWGHLVDRFSGLSRDEKQAYLHRQGYATFSHLLAHVIAWWREGSVVVATMRADPTTANPDYDVDGFNARAIQVFAGQAESVVVAAYEAQRQAMIAIVRGLTDAELERKSIHDRLYAEIIGHWREHAIE